MNRITVACLLVLCLVSCDGTDGNTVFMEAVRPLKGWRQAGFRYGDWEDNEGWWVADVTELSRHGVISRSVAKADTAPVKPLIERPRPFHGYYVRAMHSGPDGSIKGMTRSPQTFGFCIYPAETARTDLYVWIVGPYGIYRKQNGGNGPILNWPTDEERKREWWIVD